ncbi:hypothetical protein OR1_02407 [Geobacter sp. OR-1]|uniref:hypothetical protein n=1 Tax=Geobacter sp. OR-1 TaxID=1266765 RepID=UPI00054224B7|nr:hypothetical protein [Geobacter sp. OR-1]GAM10119.1 hypothetical protein OR1_02407 [Geobacter sp. OR-1]
MRRPTLALCFLLLAASPSLSADPPKTGANLGNVRGGDFSKARTIIDKSCTSCHSSAKIDEAIAAGKNMPAIQREMEKRGARLNANEKEVLGIYWKQTPLKKK